MSKKKNLERKYIIISNEHTIIKYIQLIYKSNFSKKSEFFTIEKFLEKVSGLRILDNHSVLLYLFFLLKEDDFSQNNFDNFFHWGPMILNDFQNIDINMIDVEHFFSSTISKEKINKWDFNVPKKEKKFFWEKIREYYYVLQSQLLKIGTLYQGMFFKITLSYLDIFLSKNPKTKIIYINSIISNQCEKIFIQKIIQYNHGIVYNLYEENTFESKIQDFTRIYKKYKKSKNLKIIEVSKEVEQIKAVETIIKQLIKKKLFNILIIPGDDSLLIPLLHSIKRTGINYSIKINYPLKNIPIYYTFYYIFQFLLRKNKFRKIYKKDVIKVLSNGYIQNFFLKKNSLLKKLIIENNSDSISEKTIKKYLIKNDLGIIFQIPINNTKIIFTTIISFIRKLKILLLKKVTQHLLELEFLSNLEIYMQKLKIIIRKKKNLRFEIDNIFNMYEEFVSTKTIQYTTTHHNKKGLYITGFSNFFLKDFDSVIITSFNEGIIPPKNHSLVSSDSFDFFQRMKMKNLNNNIYFSHFIRIFKSSLETYLIYKNQPDEINSGEKSRFIHQIEMNYKISKEKINNFLIPEPISIITSPIIIEKTESIIHCLHKLISKGLSPSSINLYNYNPLLFYYKKILGIENLEESYSIRKKVGKIIHQILKILYNPIKKSFLTIHHIRKMKRIYESLVKKILLKKEEFIEGKNILYYSIIKTYIENFISWDEKCIKDGHKIFVQEIELQISSILNIEGKKVNLHGIIDRIDEYDGINRILDYKIGFLKVKKMNISLKKIKKIFQDPNYSNIMQLLIYIYLWYKSSFFRRRKTTSTTTTIGIISPEKEGNILQMPINFFHQKKIEITYEDYEKYFLPYLIKRIKEILDPEIPIVEKIY